MAIDKAVDSSVLDAGLTTIANAIRTKDPTAAAALSFPSGMAEAIANIPTGGGTDYFQYATRLTNVFYGAALPQRMELNIDNVNGSCDSFIREATGLQELILHAPSGNMTDAGYMFQGAKELVTLDLSDVDTSNITTWQTATRWCDSLSTIIGTFDLTKNTAFSLGSSNGFFVLNMSAKAKADCVIVPNTINVNAYCGNNLGLAVKFANALNAAASGLTATFHATVKSQLATTMGTVTDGLFTQDASGTVSLQNFITNTKGWTIA